MVGIMFHRFGPYHYARLRGAIEASNKKVIGIELSKHDSIYQWKQEDSKLPVETLFEDEDILSMSGYILYRKIKKTIVKLQLSTLAVQGWTKWGLAGVLAAHDCKIPIILMSESNEYDFVRHPLKEYIKKMVLKLCSSALVGGEDHKNYLIKLAFPNDKIHKGYDAIDNPYFTKNSELAKKFSSDYEKKIGIDKGFFLTSNRFIQKKNLFRLIDAYKLYCLQNPKARNLVMLGDGELKEEILHYLKDQQIPFFTTPPESQSSGSNGFVYLPGFIQYDELPSFYGLAHCFIHVSTTEQWGLVVNEAMASSLPVILSKKCGCACELVQNNYNGYIVDPLSTEEIKNSMLDIASMDRETYEDYQSNSLKTIQDWGPEKFGQSFNLAHEQAIISLKRAPFRGFILKSLLMFK